MVDAWRQDVRYALQLLRRSPLFTLTAVLSLAVGIGANAAIFSVANAFLLKPLPGIANADRLVDIGRTQDGHGFDTSSYLNYRDVRERSATLSDVYAMRVEPLPMSLGQGLDTERIFVAAVSGNYFHALGTPAAHGRTLADADDQVGAAAIVVISYELWTRRFGASLDTVGRLVLLNGRDVAVVGIAPPGFQGTTLLRPDVWMPLTASTASSPPTSTSLLGNRQAVWLMMGGRLKNGVTIAQAAAELSTIAGTLEHDYPTANRGKGLKALRAAIVPGRIDVVSGFLAVLLAIVGLVLLVACVNIAGMSLARAVGRKREIAVRLAVGASRWRLIRQLLTETALLFALGCAAGLVLSEWLTRALLSVLPSLPFPVGLDVTVDWRVVVFATLVAFAASILSGLAPALHASNPDVVSALKIDGRGEGTGRVRLRSAFVVAQITVSLALIVAAALFLRALQRAGSIDPGFSQANVNVVTVDLSLNGYSRQQGLAFVQRLTDRARALNGVQSVAWASDLPLDGGRLGYGGLRAPGVVPPNGAEAFGADWNAVTPGFFKTLGIAILSGRDFTDTDTRTAPGAIIVNAAMARAVWGTTDVLGRRLEAEDPDGAQDLTVVGVASDAQLISLGDAVEPYVYVPLAQRYTSNVSLVVKSATGSLTGGELRAVMREVDPNLPAISAMPLSDVTAIERIPQRLAAAVAGTLGIVVLLLAAIGVHGVTSYTASRRTHEIGIRMALGANRADVLRMILQQGLVLTATGVGIGLVAAATGARVLRSLLFGVSTLDVVSFAGSAAVLALVALVASYLPARRATRVDPMLALRDW